MPSVISRAMNKPASNFMAAGVVAAGGTLASAALAPPAFFGGILCHMYPFSSPTLPARVNPVAVA